MGWHFDDENELGFNPVIAIISLGETRKLQFKHKTKKDIKNFSIEMINGSLLIMNGIIQHN